MLGMLRINLSYIFPSFPLKLRKKLDFPSPGSRWSLLSFVFPVLFSSKVFAFVVESYFMGAGIDVLISTTVHFGIVRSDV